MRKYEVKIANKTVERYNGMFEFTVYDSGESCVYINGVTGCSKDMVKASLTDYRFQDQRSSDLRNIKDFLAESSTVIIFVLANIEEFVF